MGMAILMGILGAVVVVVWRKAKKSPDWRTQSARGLGICPGHGGDPIEKCGVCKKTFCRECDPDGHCIAQYEPRGPWTQHS